MSYEYEPDDVRMQAWATVGCLGVWVAAIAFCVAFWAGVGWLVWDRWLR